MGRFYSTPLLDKLGLRPGMRVALIDIDGAEIRRLIADRTNEVAEGWPGPDTDLVLLGADTSVALAPAGHPGRPSSTLTAPRTGVPGVPSSAWAPTFSSSSS